MNTARSNSNNKNDNTVLIWGIIIVAVFFFVIMPSIEKCYAQERSQLRETLANVSNGNTINGIDTNKCARSCCINTGWAYPPELRPNDVSEEEMKNYIPSNFSCNFGSDNGGGCVCVKKDDFKHLSSRGGNSQVTFQ